MELHELQKMISIIHDKKPRCRGNLRVKVLLKSTHDYVRRSLLDDQLGNSESLITLLRNSGNVREPMAAVNTVQETEIHSVNTNEIVQAQKHSDSMGCASSKADSDSMDCDEVATDEGNDQELQCSSIQNMKYVSGNIPATIEAFSRSDDNCNQILTSVPTQSVVAELPECGVAFKNNNKSFDKNSDISKEKYSKLTKALRKIVKQWEMIMSKSKSDKSCLKRQCHSVKRMRKLLLESKICFKADFENLSFSQQRINQKYVWVIKKMLKQCDKFLEYK